MRLEVRLQREVARLHFQDPKRSHRAIAHSVGIAANTVKSVRDFLRAASVTWNVIKDLDDDAWQALLKNHDHSIAQRKETPNWSDLHAEMQRPNATLDQLWIEFRESCPTGVGYTQFCTGYRNWKKKLNVVMRQVHTPGKKLFVDFAGQTVKITNRDDGTSYDAQIFVAVFGFSNFTYVEAVATQTIPDWVDAHVHCFEASGGAPEWVVSDHLKAAVIKSDRDTTYITPGYAEALKHYDTAALPARPRKPKDKAKAEVGVQIVQRWILFPLRNRTFFSLDELNMELRARCEQLNDHPFKKLGGTRRIRFDETERKALKPLPLTRYEYSDWRFKVLVGTDYHVEHERSFYSVPHYLQRERVDLRLTSTTIEVMYRGNRVALHARSTASGTVHTLPEHRPIAHVRVLEGEPMALATWAASVGENTAQMFEFHLVTRSDPTNGLRAARRLRQLAEHHGSQRLEEVCKYALPLNITALRSLTSILKESADKRPRHPAESASHATHDNVRGPDYYGEKE